MKPDTRRDPAAGDGRTDHDLVYAARDGDTIAFDALFYRYRDGIFRLGLAITKDPSAAEEIVVDTFARFWREEPGYRAAWTATQIPGLLKDTGAAWGDRFTDRLAELIGSIAPATARRDRFH